MANDRLMALLRWRFPEPAWIVLEQVRNGTGFARRPRTADVLAIGMWPSRGLDVYGFEVKADRTDWLRELANPAKADAIADYCDRWSLLTFNEKIVELAEVPQTWGYTVARGQRLVDLKPAPERTPKTIDRLFLAALLRAATAGRVPADDVQRQAEVLQKRWQETETHSRSQLEHEVKRLTSLIATFEKAAGVSLARWYGDSDGLRVGAALRSVLSGTLGDAPKRAASIAETLRTIATQLDAVATSGGGHG